MRQFVDCPIDGLLVTWHHPMKFFLQIGCLIALGSTAFPQQNTREYLQHLVGRPLILRYYGDSVSPSAKEKDLSHKRVGCDEAVEVTGVTFAASSIRLQLRNIGGPSIGNNKSKTCHVSPDEYSLSASRSATRTNPESRRRMQSSRSKSTCLCGSSRNRRSA
jgi:hypothetical protein